MAKPMSPPAMPLASQTDHFRSIGKTMEEKNVGSMNSMERRCITMDLAVKEALMKGALMDRVKSLENRLLQLCMELESRGMNLPDTPLFQAFKETSSTQRRSINVGSSSTPSLGCKPSRNQTKELTTPQATIDKAKVKKKSDGEKKKPKKEAEEMKKKAIRGDREKKAMIQKKKVKPSSWFHMKLLGC